MSPKLYAALVLRSIIEEPNPGNPDVRLCGGVKLPKGGYNKDAYSTKYLVILFSVSVVIGLIFAGYGTAQQAPTSTGPKPEGTW